MTDMTMVRTAIAKIIAEQTSKPLEQVVDGATFDSLGMDSLDRVEIVMKIEEALHIELDDEHIEKVKTVGELMAYCESLKK